MQKKCIAAIVGTRPEAIKMAPVILTLKKQPWADVRVISTAQHRQMLDQVMSLFNIQPDVDFNVMQSGQSLSDLTGRLFTAFGDLLQGLKPDVILGQGDTTTVMVAATAAFYHQIPFGHVEAGLRTHDLYNPFPEEFNRVVVGRTAKWHFAPTQGAVNNLLKEGVPAASVHMTGNTVIDALLDIADRNPLLPVSIADDDRMVLVTMHRRENFGQSVHNVCAAVRSIVENYPDVHIVWPVHLNPQVHDVVHAAMADLPRVHLLPPLPYDALVAAIKRATIVLTDSGGLQEEAPALAKPVLVLRSTTERPEAVELGVAKLIGTDRTAIDAEVSALLGDTAAYAAMARGISPYGDGHAAERIAAILRQDLL